MTENMNEPMQVLVITLGSTTPPLFLQKYGTPVIDVQEYDTPVIDVKEIKIKTHDDYRGMKDDLRRDVFDFARISPRKRKLFSYKNVLAIVGTYGMWNELQAVQPRLLVFVEGVWKDDVWHNAVETASSQILSDDEWKRYSLDHGVITCLFTKHKRSLGADAGIDYSERLLTSGFDMIYDARKIKPGSNSRLIPVDLRAEAKRRYALLRRQSRWAAGVISDGSYMAAKIFFALGVLQAIAALIITSIFMNVKDIIKIYFH